MRTCFCCNEPIPTRLTFCDACERYSCSETDTSTPCRVTSLRAVPKLTSTEDADKWLEAL